MTIARSLLLMLCLGVLAGCSGDKPTKVVTPVDGLPAGTPINDSVDHLLARFPVTFEAKSNVEYAKLLTDDFRFHFSAQADPKLVAAYGDNWRRADEDTAITHLFRGFTNSDPVPQYIPAAIHVDMTLNPLQVIADSSHADSVDFYQKCIVANLQMTIEIPSSTGGDPTTYQIGDGARQEFFLVRGDAAVLGPGQEPRADLWYIRRWDDLTVAPPFVMGPVLNATRTSTIGSVKARYR
jgi:hypothetical protein